MPALVTDPGQIDSDLTFDGVSLAPLPVTISFNRQKRRALGMTGNGMRRADMAIDGDGLPDVLDIIDFFLKYQFDSNYKTQCAFLETLRAQGGYRQFVWWKAFRYFYTAQQGQTVFYTPRVDAFTKGYAGKTTSPYKAVLTITNGIAAPTLLYKASVVAGDAIAADEVWFSNTAAAHPDTGKDCTLFKFAAAPTNSATLATVMLDYIQLFYCDADVVAEAFDSRVGREDKSLSLTELL